MTTARRVKGRQNAGTWFQYPAVRYPCGCHTTLRYCDVAARLWDRAAVANHNLTLTRKRVEGWPLTTLHMFGPERIKRREAIYEYRLAKYQAHFKVPA